MIEWMFFDGFNADKIEHWADNPDAVHKSNFTVAVQRKEGWTRAHAGDMIVRFGNAENGFDFEVYTPKKTT